MGLLGTTSRARMTRTSVSQETAFGQAFTPITSNAYEIKTKISEGHDWPPHEGNRGNIGGPFSLTTYRVHSESYGPFNLAINNRTYTGGLFAYSNNLTQAGQWPGTIAATTGTLNAAGTTAIARSLPTNPVANMSVALGEVYRDGIPHFSSDLKRRIGYAKSAGSDYLNVEFGWKPLLADLKAFAHAMQKSKHILAQYERDSGKNIRRRYVFPSVTSSTSSVRTNNTFPGPAIYAGFYPSGGVQQHIDTTNQTDRWFSGAFTYYLTNGSYAADKVMRAVQESNKLFGTRLNPEVVWNLAPWSWAADWVSNIGDVMHNVSAFHSDGLVMRYGYMMEETSVMRTYTLPNLELANYGAVTLTQTLETNVKQRVKATPFGFGLNIGNFTVRQWAILVALGISQAPGKAP